jgi:hypothetical protein
MSRKIIHHCEKCKIEIMTVDVVLHNGLCTKCYLNEQYPYKNKR